MIELSKNCCGCFSCYSVCSQNAVSLYEKEDGFLYPKINSEKCINCHLCERVCPDNKKYESSFELKSYAFINNKNQIVLNSSSGGFFSTIAEKVIESGGIVFGAKFDEKYNVIHDYIEKIEDLYLFRGSKYLSSLPDDSYRQCKNKLEEGKFVLYTGLPCQIAGLKSFLKKDYDNLLTIDMICHGVPSSKIWQLYLSYLEAKYKSKVKEVKFRNKKKSWIKFNLCIDFENSKKYISMFNNDIYMNLFLNNLILRKSCYSCNFKGENSGADITMADYWGINKIDSSLYNKNGVSLVIIKSEKGNKIFDSLNNCFKQETDFNKAISYNKGYLTSSVLNKRREEFFSDFNKMNFEEIKNKYMEKKTKIFLKKIKRKINEKILKKK